MKSGSRNETVDHLRRWDVKVIQSIDGYRFAVDSLILAALADIPERGRVIDIGTGNGVVAFIVAKRFPQVEVVGLEVQPQMVERARRGVKVNGLEGRVEVVEGSFLDVRELFPPESFHYAISNPPFWPAGSGRPSPNRERAVATCEVCGSLQQLADAMGYLLPSRGRAGLIMCAERVGELLFALRKARLEPKRLRFVHPRLGEEAQFVFVEAVKNARPGGCRVEPPLVIYHGDAYTEEMKRLVGVR